MKRSNGSNGNGRKSQYRSKGVTRGGVGGNCFDNTKMNLRRGPELVKTCRTEPAGDVGENGKCLPEMW